MYTGYSFICAFYEIIKRYDSFEEVCRLGSFGAIKPANIFLYLNGQDETFFFDVEGKTIEGFNSVSLSIFFRQFRDYRGSEELLNYKIILDNECKLNALIFNEIASNFSPEYLERAASAFNGFLRPLHSTRVNNFNALASRELENKLNACIERTESILNRKINFDNL